MAFIQMSILSQKLMRTVPVNVVLPVDKMVFPGLPARKERPYKTLYLLHGVLGSHIDWGTGSRIQRYAEENDLAVVMPAGENAFYVDHPKSNNFYGEFIGEELVELTRKMFPLSHRREDTFIGGLSMGGYGALRNGLKYSDTFGYIVSLSGAFVLEGIEERTNDTPRFIESRDYAEACFGDLATIHESDKDPKFLIRSLKQQGKEIPEIYMACGQDDSLLGANQDMAEYLKAHGAQVSFAVGPGSHEWDFWDTYIKKGIEWLPTEENGQGVNSGNVGI